MEENRLIRVSHTQKQSRRLLNGMNGVRSSSNPHHGGSSSSSSSSSGGGGSVAEFVDSSAYALRDGADTRTGFVPPPQKQQEEEDEEEEPIVHHGDGKGSAGMCTELRKCVGRQWQSPAFAWANMKATSMQKLFHAAPSNTRRKLADVKERFVDGGMFSDVDEDEKMAERKVVAVVLAFQRWRHTQLKNIFSQELKKVLEEAREDEATLAALETELENSEEHLAMALADSAQLRTQLAAATNSNHFEESYPDDSTVKETDRQMMRAMEGLAAAEAEVRRRDNEIRQLKERLKSIEEQGGRIDGQLQTNVSLLQAEKNGALEENRVLLEQLARRDEEVRMQGEEMERLKAIVARLAERQSVDQQHIDSLKTEHNAEIQSLQEQLRQAYEAKCSKEMELASYTERCSGLGQERETLVLQLHHAVERANQASCRAEELQMKLHCTAEDRAKASEEVALEMVKHLKRLTDHMRELESTVITADRHSSASSFRDGLTTSVRARLENRPGSKLACDGPNNKGGGATPDSDHVPYTSPHNSDSGVWDDYRMCTAAAENAAHGQKHVCFSPLLEQRPLKSSSRLGEQPPPQQHKVLDRLKTWIAWKWRWAASSARAELLAQQLHGIGKMKAETLQLICGQTYKQEKAEDLIQRLRSGNLTTCMEKELNFMLTEHRLVPLILSAWRAFARTCILEKKAISRSASLDKMMEALPWWIRRVGERRHLERNFFHWQLLTLRTHRQPKPPKASSNKQAVEAASVRLSHAETQRPTLLPPPPSTKNFDQKAHVDQRGCGVTGGDVGVPPQKKLLRVHAAAAITQKRNPGDGGKLSAGVPQPAETNHHLKPNNGTVSTSRALQALQTSLQQEVTELQTILSQEIQALQHQGDNSRSVTEPTTLAFKDQCGPDRKRALRSVLGVCNNLAMALTDVRGKLCSQGLVNTNKVAVSNSNANKWVRPKREPPSAFTLKIIRGRPNARSPRSPRRGGPGHVQMMPARQVRPRILRHHYPWVGGGIRMASPNRPTRHVVPRGAHTQRQYSPKHADEKRMRHSSPGAHGRNRSLSPATTRAKIHHAAAVRDVARSPRCSPPTARKQSPQTAKPLSRGELCSRRESPDRAQKPAMASKPKASVKMSGKESGPRTTTVVEITPDGNYCSEIAIRTEPSQDTEPTMGAPEEDKKTPRSSGPAASTRAKEKLVEDKAALVSLKEKHCIGTAYANLLSAEISRLRQGRGHVSQLMEDKVKLSNSIEVNVPTATSFPNRRPSRSRP